MHTYTHACRHMHAGTYTYMHALILDLDFDILGITETRIIKEQNPTYDTSITGYKEYFTPTESTKGGTS